MRGNKLKNIVLSALTVALIYIWYGNVQLFWDDSSEITSSTRTISLGSTDYDSSIAVEPLEYMEPKINPFAETSTTPASVQHQPKPQQNRRRNSATKAQPLVSSSYRLVGSLNTGKTRLATLADNAGKQFLIARGDSLSGWKAVRVRDKSIVFAHEKRRDTLRLAQVDLQ